MIFPGIGLLSPLAGGLLGGASGLAPDTVQVEIFVDVGIADLDLSAAVYEPFPLDSPIPAAVQPTLASTTDGVVDLDPVVDVVEDP